MIKYNEAEEGLVSVIVPGYNYAHFIKETLDSLVNQSYQNWECIVVDNGSTDNTVQVLEAYCLKDNRFRLIKLDRGTTSATRNAGIANSSGEFILFLDADDQIGPEKIKRSIEKFETGYYDLVYGISKYYDDGAPGQLRDKMHNESHTLLRDFEGDSSELIEKMIYSNLFTICAPIIRKEKIAQINGFKDRLNWVEDWDFYIRLMQNNCRIGYCDDEQAACFIRVHKSSLSKKSIGMMEQSIEVRNNLQAVIEQLNPVFKTKAELTIDNKLEIKFLHKMLYSQCLKTEKIKALKHLIEFFKLDKNPRLFIKALLQLPFDNDVFESNAEKSNQRIC